MALVVKICHTLEEERLMCPPGLDFVCGSTDVRAFGGTKIYAFPSWTVLYTLPSCSINCPAAGSAVTGNGESWVAMVFVWSRGVSLWLNMT